MRSSHLRSSALFLAALLSGCASQSPDRMAAAPIAAASDHANAYQRLPAANARYRDGDPNARAEPRLNPEVDQHAALVARAAQGPSVSAEDLARQGYLLSLRGDRDGAIATLDEARTRFPDNGRVYWTLGWVWLNLDEPAAALAAWQEAERIHGGRPAWVPYSKAIALIALNDEEAAIAWWQVARRTLPYQLGSAKRALRTFSYWRPKERALLERLIALAYPD